MCYAVLLVKQLQNTFFSLLKISLKYVCLRFKCLNSAKLAFTLLLLKGSNQVEKPRLLDSLETNGAYSLTFRISQIHCCHFKLDLVIDSNQTWSL